MDGQGKRLAQHGRPAADAAWSVSYRVPPSEDSFVCLVSYLSVLFVPAADVPLLLSGRMGRRVENAGSTMNSVPYSRYSRLEFTVP